MARRTRYSSFRVERTRTRVGRVAVGATLVLLVTVAVLAPVLGLVGSAAAAGPFLDVPWGSITVAVVIGYLASLSCLALAFVTRRPGLGWFAVACAVLFALVASLWPVVAMADTAVDRARDVLPWIVDLVRRYG